MEGSRQAVDLQALTNTMSMLNTTVGDIETHFRLRDEERANEVRVALESVYHHQHASDSQRLLRYREYARRLLAAKIRDKQQAVARTLDTMISERYLPAEIPAWLTDSEEFSSFLKPFREIYEDYIKAYKHHQTRERAIQQVESEWRRQQSDSARSASAPMVQSALDQLDRVWDRTKREYADEFRRRLVAWEQNEGASLDQYAGSGSVVPSPSRARLVSAGGSASPQIAPIDRDVPSPRTAAAQATALLAASAARTQRASSRVSSRSGSPPKQAQQSQPPLSKPMSLPLQSVPTGLSSAPTSARPDMSGNLFGNVQGARLTSAGGSAITALSESLAAFDPLANTSDAALMQMMREWDEQDQAAARGRGSRSGSQKDLFSTEPTGAGQQFHTQQPLMSAAAAVATSTRLNNDVSSSTTAAAAATSDSQPIFRPSNSTNSSSVSAALASLNSTFDLVKTRRAMLEPFNSPPPAQAPSSSYASSHAPAAVPLPAIDPSLDISPEDLQREFQLFLEFKRQLSQQHPQSQVTTQTLSRSGSTVGLEPLNPNVNVRPITPTFSTQLEHASLMESLQNPSSMSRSSSVGSLTLSDVTSVSGATQPRTHHPQYHPYHQNNQHHSLNAAPVRAVPASFPMSSPPPASPMGAMYASTLSHDGHAKPKSEELSLLLPEGPVSLPAPARTGGLNASRLQAIDWEARNARDAVLSDAGFLPAEPVPYQATRDAVLQQEGLFEEEPSTLVHWRLAAGSPSMAADLRMEPASLKSSLSQSTLAQRNAAAASTGALGASFVDSQNQSILLRTQSQSPTSMQQSMSRSFSASRLSTSTLAAGGAPSIGGGAGPLSPVMRASLSSSLLPSVDRPMVPQWRNLQSPSAMSPSVQSTGRAASPSSARSVFASPPPSERRSAGSPLTASHLQSSSSFVNLHGSASSSSLLSRSPSAQRAALASNSALAGSSAVGVMLSPMAQARALSAAQARVSPSPSSGSLTYAQMHHANASQRLAAGSVAMPAGDSLSLDDGSSIFDVKRPAAVSDPVEDNTSITSSLVFSFDAKHSADPLSDVLSMSDRQPVRLSPRSQRLFAVPVPVVSSVGRAPDSPSHQSLMLHTAGLHSAAANIDSNSVARPHSPVEIRSHATDMLATSPLAALLAPKSVMSPVSSRQSSSPNSASAAAKLSRSYNSLSSNVAAASASAFVVSNSPSQTNVNSGPVSDLEAELYRVSDMVRSTRNGISYPYSPAAAAAAAKPSSPVTVPKPISRLDFDEPIEKPKAVTAPVAAPNPALPVFHARPLPSELSFLDENDSTSDFGTSDLRLDQSRVLSNKSSFAAAAFEAANAPIDTDLDLPRDQYWAEYWRKYDQTT